MQLQMQQQLQQMQQPLQQLQNLGQLQQQGQQQLLLPGGMMLQQNPNQNSVPDGVLSGEPQLPSHADENTNTGSELH